MKSLIKKQKLAHLIKRRLIRDISALVIKPCVYNKAWLSLSIYQVSYNYKVLVWYFLLLLRALSICWNFQITNAIAFGAEILCQRELHHFSFKNLFIDLYLKKLFLIEFLYFKIQFSADLRNFYINALFELFPLPHLLKNVLRQTFTDSSIYSASSVF